MINKNITRLRKSKGLTQVDFAKQLHVTQSAVSHWESGRSIPDTVQLFRIAEFFGVSVEDLSQIKVLEETAKVEPTKIENTPADMRAEAKALLEEMTDDEYNAALQYLKFLKSQK